MEEGEIEEETWISTRIGVESDSSDDMRELVSTFQLYCRLKKVQPLEPEEAEVQSLGQEAPLERERATHSSILACEIPWTEKPGRLPSMGLQRVRHD